MTLTKTALRAFQKSFRDHIPAGEALTREQVARLVFRETSEFEIYHCNMKTGDDIQSGPYYCGDVADFVAPGPGGGVVTLCRRHKRRLER